MIKHIATLGAIALLSLPPRHTDAQDLVNSLFLGTRTKFELSLLFGQPVDYDIRLYRIHYTTPGTDNALDTASGLLALPDVSPEMEFPIVVYGHGTTNGPTDVPSQLRGGYEIAMGYASKGFITAAPDYLGLGDSRGFHPYAHAATEASASRDMLFAVQQWLANNPLEWDAEHLFLTGYSQGGHTSAALHRELQLNWPSLPVTAATHMSGPYSISGVMRDQVLGDEPYNYPSYIAYVVMGYQEVYDNLYGDIHEIFKEPYVTNIINFRNGTITLSALNTQLIALLNSNTGTTVVKHMLQDSILDKMINDSAFILNQVLRENDVFEWAPLAPTRLYYCGGDTQVPHENALVAESAMQALGAPDVDAVNINAVFDHAPCVLPSVTNSIQFFESFLEPSAVKNFAATELIDIVPNPAAESITVQWDKAKSGMTYVVINLDGQIIREGVAHNNAIDVASLPAGLYSILITAQHETRLARLIRS